jgi:predicted ATPase with chaperone activity
MEAKVVPVEQQVSLDCFQVAYSIIYLRANVLKVIFSNLCICSTFSAENKKCFPHPESHEPYELKLFRDAPEKRDTFKSFSISSYHKRAV